MKTLRWIFAVYLAGWLGMWAWEGATGCERIRIPGVTRQTASLDFAARSPREALLSRKAHVGYNLILSHRFPWFLPKSSSSVCSYDNIPDNRGLLVVRNDANTLLVTCAVRGEGTLRCAGATWVIACDSGAPINVRRE